MPFDGVLTNCIAKELNAELAGARVDKIHMPEKDEVLIALRGINGNCKLLINVNSSMVRVHLTTAKKENPNSPPMFCMLLRKYLVGGRILSISSYGYERVLIFEVESSNELGDRSIKKLIVEIMGKHSNIILINSGGTIIDSIFHIDSSISSKREVMPARPYEWPPSQNKISPKDLNQEIILENFKMGKGKIEKVILDLILGFSPVLSKEACFRANMPPQTEIETLETPQLLLLAQQTTKLIGEITNCQWDPAVYFSDNQKVKPIDFHCVKLSRINDYEKMDTTNHALDTYFNSKIFDDKLKQSKMALMKVVSSNQDRCEKKLALQQLSIKESSSFDVNRKLGDILTANIHQLSSGLENVELPDFYSEDESLIKIELDKNLTPQRNAQRYYKKYNKLKKTFEQGNLHATETRRENEYLESLEEAINQANNDDDLGEIRLELTSQNYMSASRRKDKKDKNSKVVISTPNEYLSTDGFTIYSGKNNRQNDLLTLKSSRPDDLWLHTQKIPGSHVIIKTRGKQITDRTLEEAAVVSAWNSRAKNSSKVLVDYTQVRNVKKPNGAKPGMVTYEKFKTIIVTPDEKIIKKIIANK